MTTPAADTRSPARRQVARTVVGLVDEIVGGVDLLGIEVTAATTFHEDLQLESVDLVTLAGMLTDTYGRHVNLADRLADMDLGEIVDLSVGDVIDYVCSVVEDEPEAGR